MNCYFCHYPLLVQDDGNPKLTHQYATVQCSTCKAFYRINLTVLHDPELSTAQLAERANKWRG